MKDKCHPSHVTRVSIDSSSYDEICINCGATDMVIGGWGELRFPCSNPQEITNDLWKEYENDFNAMSDDQIERECEEERRNLDTAESWLEAVESWKKAGKPRKGWGD